MDVRICACEAMHTFTYGFYESTQTSVRNLAYCWASWGSSLLNCLTCCSSPLQKSIEAQKAELNDMNTIRVSLSKSRHAVQISYPVTVTDITANR